MCCYSPRFSGTEGTFRAFLCLVRLNKLQLDSPSSSHYISRGGESISGAKMTPLPPCMSKALTPLSLTRRCNLTSTPRTGATKIYTHIYVQLVQCNKWWTHMYKCNLHSSFSTSVCFDIFALHISVKVLSQVTVCSCQINSPECSLGRFHCTWSGSSCQSPGEARTALANDDYGKRLKFSTMCFILGTMHHSSNQILRMFSFFSKQGLAYIHPLYEYKPKRPLVKHKPATLKGTLSVKCTSTAKLWCLIDLLLLWIFINENQPKRFRLWKGVYVVPSERCSLLLSWHHAKGWKKEKVAAKLNIFLALLTDGGVWSQKTLEEQLDYVIRRRLAHLKSSLCF